MTPFRKSAALALGIALLGSAAYAAEKCACCKEGEKMACCDEMKKETPKPGQPAPAAPEHQH